MWHELLEWKKLYQENCHGLTLDLQAKYLNHVKIKKDKEEEEKIRKAAELAKKEQAKPEAPGKVTVDAFDTTYEIERGHEPAPLPPIVPDSRSGTPVYDPAIHGRNIGFDPRQFPSPPPGRMTPGLAETGHASMQPDPEPNTIAPLITPLPTTVLQPQPRRAFASQEGLQQQGYQQQSSHAQFTRANTPTSDLSGEQYGQRPQSANYGRGRDFFGPSGQGGLPPTPSSYNPSLPDLRSRSPGIDYSSGGAYRGPTGGDRTRRYAPYTPGGMNTPRARSPGPGGYGS